MARPYEEPLGERVARLEAQMSEIVSDIKEIGRAVNGPNGSVRTRLHKLENDNAAAKAAQAALSAARAVEGQRWTVKERVGLFGFAATAAVLGVLNALGVT